MIKKDNILKSNKYNRMTDMYGGGPVANEEFYLNQPYGIAINNTGYIFVADTYNHCIHIFSPHPDYTLIYTIGTLDIPGATNYTFNNPNGIAIHRFGDEDILYVADKYNHRIQVFRININEANNTITAVHLISPNGSPHSIGTGIDGNNSDAFSYPYEIRIHNDILYVADSNNHRIQMFSITINNIDNTITSIHIPSQPGSPHSIGIGQADFLNNTFDFPTGIAIHRFGDEDILYVADRNNHRIQVFRITINLANNTITALHLPSQPRSPHSIGTGISGDTGNTFFHPIGLAIHRFGDEDILYVADANNNRIQMFRININDANNTITATYLPGPNGGRDSLRPERIGNTGYTFFYPNRLAIHNDILYVSDAFNNRIHLFNGDITNPTTLQYYDTFPPPSPKYTILNQIHMIPIDIRNTRCMFCNFNVCTSTPHNPKNNVNGYVVRLDTAQLRYFHYTCIYNYITSHNQVDTYQIGVNKYDTDRLIVHSRDNNNFEGTDFFIPDFIILNSETDVPANSRDTSCRLCGLRLCKRVIDTPNNANGYVVHLHSFTQPNRFYYHYKCISRYFIQIILSASLYKSPHCATVLDRDDIHKLLNIDRKADAISGNGFY
jgi:hypothetical protein